MKGYKRLTERRYGLVIDNCGNCPNVHNYQGCTDKKCYEIIKNRLANIEDKIDSGEICDREEVRKETAREILQILYNRTKNYYGNRITLTSDNVKEFAERYGIDLEEQQ